MAHIINTLLAEDSAQVGGIEVALRVQNIVYVKQNPGPGEFSSIVAALASVTTASSSNPYKIVVGPGVYPGTLTMKPYVWIEGSEQDQTIITATTGDHAVYGADNSGISKCLIDGALASGKAAIFYQSLVGTTNTSFFVEDCRLGNNDHLAISDGSIAATAIFFENCKFGSTYQFDHGFLAQAGGRVVVRNSTTTGLTAPFPDFVFKATGTNSSIVLNGVQCRSGSVTSDACIHLANGALCRALSTNIRMFGKALWIENVGAASLVDAVGMLFEGNTVDIQVDHPGGDGTFNGSADHNKIIVDPSSTFSVVISSNALPSDGTGSVTVGTILQGDRYDRLVNLSKLVRESSTMGAVTGGVISLNSGFDVDVSSGNGFLLDQTFMFVKELNWASDTLTIPANSIRYIFIDTNNTVQQSASPQDLIYTIPLGRVTTNSTGVRYIEDVEMDLVHVGNKIEQFLRNLGPVFGSGAIVTEHTTPRELAVTSGQYNYGINPLSLVGGAPITFISNYRDGVGGWIEVTGQTLVSNTQYDNNSGTLASIPAGKYASHTLYALGDSGNEKWFIVYSQNVYNTEGDARAAELPLLPPWISEAVVKIASIIVQQGDPNIVSPTVDIRPRIGFAPPSSAGTTDHGALTGLLDDDHPQYLLVTGTRAMTGNLDMGGNNVTNVNLVDGVDVSTHAARHLPGGADALTTAAPVTNITTSSANADGAATSFSRSDHGHKFVTRVVTKTANYTIIADDDIIYVDSSGGAFNLTLPSPALLAGRTFRVIDKTGFLSTNNVTLIPNGAEKISGLAANKILQTAWGEFSISTDGTDWYVG